MCPRGSEPGRDQVRGQGSQALVIAPHGPGSAPPSERRGRERCGPFKSRAQVARGPREPRVRRAAEELESGAKVSSQLRPRARRRHRPLQPGACGRPRRQGQGQGQSQGRAGPAVSLWRARGRHLGQARAGAGGGAGDGAAASPATRHLGANPSRCCLRPDSRRRPLAGGEGALLRAPGPAGFRARGVPGVPACARPASPESGGCA